jgi:calpain-15
MFEQDVTPNDIIQGSLGNCYFLSALSAIAEFPQRIKNIFITQNIT